ncbi:hypothetical protein GCM10009768_11810 [Leucobacter iarius]|uniref:Uncharacterized protein n=1 Tax=Leucobacter iarius TaxID=333963 RepID=A0ABP4XMG2_9MICO
MRPASTARPRALLIAGIALLVIFVGMGAAVLADPAKPWSQGIDDAWRSAVGVGPDSPLPGSPVAMFFQQLGQLPGMIVFALVLPIVLVALGRWRSAIFVFLLQLAGPGPDPPRTRPPDSSGRCSPSTTGPSPPGTR